MAAERERSCPVCCDAQEDVAYLTPCLHQFCLGCIVRWAKTTPSCPLCRRTVNTIIYSVWSDDDFLELALPHPSDPPVAVQQDEQGAVEMVPSTYVAGLQPQAWAALFRDFAEILEPLLPWLNRELTVLYGGRWWEAAAAQGTIVVNLCYYGLDEEALVRELQPFLRHQTGTFVRQLIDVAAERCGEQILRQMERLDSHAAEEGEHSPAATPSPTTSQEGTPDSSQASSSSPATSDQEELPSTAQAALHGGPSNPPPALVPAEQELPQEEPQEVAEAGPSAQGCSRSPSAPGQGRHGSPGGPRRAPKRRAPSPQDSPQPPKRRPRQQH
ncbi:TOPRS ligase, partial [Podilymbus podiceps]|nr:TOPRS ligase [Podilymbus podiceps]